MKYLKLYEQLKDNIITNKYYIWVSLDEKYVIFGKLLRNHESTFPSTKDYTPNLSDYYYGVFPIEMLDNNMSRFTHNERLEGAEQWDLFLMIREGNMDKMPNTPARNGYERMELTLKDFKQVRYIEGVFLDKKLNL